MARDLTDVLDQMAQHGIRPAGNVDFDLAFRRYVRFKPDGQKGAKKTAFVRLSEYVSKSGQRYISGVFGNRGDVWKVESSAADWSPAERAAWVEAQKAAAKVAAAERKQEGEDAAKKASSMWRKARTVADGTDGGHPYLQRKGVAAFGLRIGFNDRLLVPMRDAQGGDVQGLQYVTAEGEKLFGTGTVKEGRSHLIGRLDAGVEVLAFGEGYATCASVHMATGWPVVVCFDAGNLAVVVGEYRRLYPELAFVLAADDDRHLLKRLSERLAKHGIGCTEDELRQSLDRSWVVPDGPCVELVAAWRPGVAGVMQIEGTLTVDGRAQPLLLENAGQAKAHAAAKKHKCRVLTPRFADRSAPGTDWNDLQVAEGIDRVKALIADLMAADPEKPGANVRAQRAETGAGRKMASKLARDEQANFSFEERFTLIYGTTTVWDAQIQQIIKLEALRVAFGRGLDFWLESPERRMVTQDRVVFDPSGQCQAPDYVNLFDGLPVVPVAAPEKCELIVEHVFNLCQRNDEIFQWVIRWLAYPLQNPGAKMRTALILHGRTEGTGKSKLGEIMRRLYGRYCTSVGQAELQRDFNEWMSAKLLVLAEEVVSRQDRAHHQGMLQAMVTQPTVQINQKNMPVREEANHANFIFFSNQQLPVLLNPTDRRYMVIRVEEVRPPEYFKALDEELDSGGAEAFMYYLMNYPLDGFNAHTKPLHTKDRTHLITLGMTADQRFFEFWRLGHADLPFCCCPASDLYQAFLAWCRINGERFKPTSTQFGRTVTEQLERLQCPDKRIKRYEAYSDKQLHSDKELDDEQMSFKQGVVYFVSAEHERLTTRADDDAKPPERAFEDVTQSAYYNAKIKLFQGALKKLLESSKRAFG